MITAITKYKTNDGKLFDTYNEASEYITDTICENFYNKLGKANIDAIGYMKTKKVISDLFDTIEKCEAMKKIFNLLNKDDDEYILNYFNKQSKL